MARLPCAVCALIVLLTPSPQNSPLLKYKAVDAYEVRSGILMFPRYAEDGSVCEVAFERHHYAPEKIVVSSTLYRQEIDAIVDELAPASERGPRSGGPSDGLVSLMGHGMTRIEEYENVTVQIGSAVIDNPGGNAIVEDLTVLITWRHRQCKQSETSNQQPLSITIEASDLVVAGRQVELQIKVLNTSHATMVARSGFQAYDGDPTYEYVCHDSAGNSVSKELKMVGSVHDAPLVKPGETYKSTVLLDRVCDLSRPGRYEIQLYRGVPMGQPESVIKSNKITVDVVPPIGAW